MNRVITNPFTGESVVTNEKVSNAFCPTGEGGGRDPSCGGDDGSSAAPVPKARLPKGHVKAAKEAKVAQDRKDFEDFQVVHFGKKLERGDIVEIPMEQIPNYTLLRGKDLPKGTKIRMMVHSQGQGSDSFRPAVSMFEAKYNRALANREESYGYAFSKTALSKAKLVGKDEFKRSGDPVTGVRPYKD